MEGSELVVGITDYMLKKQTRIDCAFRVQLIRYK